MKKLILLFTFIFFGLFVKAQNSSANSLLWEISGPEGKVSYLFGTYHLLGSDFLKENTSLNKAYTSSKQVVVEMVMDSAQLPQMVPYYMMQGSLKAMMDSTEYQMLATEIEPMLGAPIAMLDNMKPMALATMLSMQMAQSETPDTFLFEGSPIDLFFAAEAKKEAKKVVPLETMLEQVELLMNSQTIEDQLEGLVYLVTEKEEVRAMTQNTIKAYIEQDLAAMLQISNDYEDEMGEMSALIDDRNKNWIPKLLPLLDQGSTFIAVGALHLPGENGLIELLQNEGYALRPITLK